MNGSLAESGSEWDYLSNSEEDTNRLGQVLGEMFDREQSSEAISGRQQSTSPSGSAAQDMEPRSGLVVALRGDLGAGKTRLVQAIATGLGVERKTVTSPTFILIQEYVGKLPIYHFDTYRLQDTEEFLELGADEIMESPGICLIEWADRVAEMLPQDVLWIDVTIESVESRRFRFRGTGPRSRRVMADLQTALNSG